MESMKALLFVDHNSNAFHLKSPPSLALSSSFTFNPLERFLCKSEMEERAELKSCLRNGLGTCATMKFSVSRMFHWQSEKPGKTLGTRSLLRRSLSASG